MHPVSNVLSHKNLRFISRIREPSKDNTTDTRGGCIQRLLRPAVAPRRSIGIGAHCQGAVIMSSWGDGGFPRSICGAPRFESEIRNSKLMSTSSYILPWLGLRYRPVYTSRSFLSKVTYPTKIHKSGSITSGQDGIRSTPILASPYDDHNNPTAACLVLSQKSHRRHKNLASPAISLSHDYLTLLQNFTPDFVLPLCCYTLQNPTP